MRCMWMQATARPQEPEAIESSSCDADGSSNAIAPAKHSNTNKEEERSCSSHDSGCDVSCRGEAVSADLEVAQTALMAETRPDSAPRRVCDLI